MTIHSGHPFADPEPDPVRRLRGHLPGAVTLITAGVAAPDGHGRAGLTVSSVMVAAGETARVLALVDPDSDLADALATGGAAVLQLLGWEDRGLAEVFAGTAPAPGGMFAQAAFEDTAWGPRLLGDRTWAGLRLEQTTDAGWSSLVTLSVEHVEVGADDGALVHQRGRFRRLA